MLPICQASYLVRQTATLGLRPALHFDTFPSFPLEKAMAPHSSTLAWKIPGMEEAGGLQSMGSLRVRHD